MTGIIDYGVCNVGSIRNMLKKIGEDDIQIISEAEGLQSADRVILPGVGSFDSGMDSLEEKGLVKAIQMYAREGYPILGICLGMQLLGTKSEEGKKEGLGLVPMECKRFDFNKVGNSDKHHLKIPHMGWDEVDVAKNSLLTDGIEYPQRYYFVHSYHAVCDDRYSILSCDYGYRFVAAVQNENVYGVQFHPEKSHNFGLRLLKNFVCIQ